MKLFVVCVILVLPNLGTVCLFQIVTRFLPWSQMSQATTNLVVTLYKPFDIGTWAGQPFVLMAMSKDFRREVLSDFYKLVRRIPFIHSCCLHYSQSVDPQTQNARTGGTTQTQKFRTGVITKSIRVRPLFDRTNNNTTQINTVLTL